MVDGPQVHLVSGALDATAVSAGLSSPGHGATVLFVGTVRNSHQGRAVRGILYTAYASMAEEVLARIEHELGERHGASVRIRHRIGELAVGEASIVIVACTPHRDAAYAANREALERVKREVPIWKREIYADGGEAWREVEPLG